MHGWFGGGMHGCCWREGVRGCSGGAWLLLGGWGWLLPGGGACVVAPRGHAWLLWGVHGCSRGVRGCSGGMHGCSRGCVWLLQGWHVWLLRGGHAWLLRGCMRGIRRHTEIRSMRGRYASYWNAFLWGLYCETDVNQCGTNPCENGATCQQDVVNSFMCVCPPGYMGSLCQVRISTIGCTVWLYARTSMYKYVVCVCVTLCVLRVCLRLSACVRVGVCDLFLADEVIVNRSWNLGRDAKKYEEILAIVFFSWLLGIQNDEQSISIKCKCHKEAKIGKVLPYVYLAD